MLFCALGTVWIALFVRPVPLQASSIHCNTSAPACFTQVPAIAGLMP